jgi:hypothetical protein
MTDVPFATVSGGASIRPLPLQVLLNPHRRGARMRPFLPPHTMVASGRFCCKSRFALVVGNSAGRRCAFRVRMWGASSPHVKLTGDFANVSDAIRIGDCFPFRNFAKNSSPCNFRLLQQYRPDSCRGCRRPARQLMTEADSRTAANGIEKIRVARLWRGRLTPATSSISSQGGCSRRAGSRPILHERWRRDGSRRPLAP